MGLIKDVFRSASSTFSDQYLDFFSGDMNPRDLMRRIYARHERGANTKANEGVITNGSKIVVPPGVACVITDNGLVREFVTEPGEYTFDSGTESSFFDSQGIFHGIKDVFNKGVQRLKSGGESSKDMRVYYINAKEILDNLFGTPEPVPYEDPRYLSINLKYHGAYSFKIIDPITFVQQVAGTVSQVYTADDYATKIKPEFMTKLNEVINRQEVPYNKLSSRGSEITAYMNHVLDDAWTTSRGIQIMSVGLQGITLDAKSQARVEKMSDALFFSDRNNAAGLMADAGAAAMRNAASNEGGAAMGFFGMNQAGQAMNQMGQFVNAMPEQNKPEVPSSNGSPQQPNPNEWICSCGERNQGKFCASCGKPNPIQNGDWRCECGHICKSGTKFCSECGKPCIH